MSNSVACTTLRLLGFLIMATGITGCGTVREKTAPCKRPANLTAFAEDTRRDCGAALPVNEDPVSAYMAISTFLKN